jgi:glucokinase
VLQLQQQQQAGALDTRMQACVVVLGNGLCVVYAMIARADNSEEQQEKVQVCGCAAAAAAAAAAAGWCP